MCRNKGINFDFEVFLADVPVSQIASFKALAGILHSILSFSDERGIRASFMMLVNGGFWFCNQKPCRTQVSIARSQPIRRVDFDFLWVKELCYFS